ncbi:diguanylate cyclase [Sphingomonas sp.]|uniref:diguanylate cyclase n=1 Tax=Sphingomonas sp. TaxID=28214 RepID=UPI002B81207A|nr:diguanylate cyclase [Sphingomonas sp.]HTG38051.1 diguanylate cyclase [Sphingomonas sp.]
MHGSRVLIVDDVAVNLALMCALVEGNGLEPVGFTDPVEALAWCERERPDLVLLDYAMPGMNGETFVRRLRMLEPGGMVPVIVVTGNAGSEMMVRMLEAGANDFLRKPVDPIELSARARSMAQLGRASQAWFELATRDELTGLDTRRHFLSRLDAEVARSQRYGAPLSMALFDVDHFKRINDQWGHPMGDAVLRALGNRIARTIRETDFAGRLGGEEFGWAMPTTADDAALIAVERVRSAIAAVPLAEQAITVSLGVATLRPGEMASDFLVRADRLLYQSKDAGRNRISADRAPDHAERRPVA